MAACSTEQENCIAGVTRDVRTLGSLIVETRGNIDRGYAIDQVQEVQERRSFCEVENDDGETFRQFCTETNVVTRDRPRAIDLNAETAKLNSMLDHMDLMRAESVRGVAQCRQRYRES
jgi:hypothetical protein